MPSGAIALSMYFYPYRVFEGDDAMDAWDQEKLEDVVDKKHGSKNKGLPPTTIVSIVENVRVLACG